jgi:hypothetical protein
MKITFDAKSLLEGMRKLPKDVKQGLSGSSNQLNELARKRWEREFKNEGVLSKGRNGREWFSPNKKKWFITNEWTVPDPIWGARNFIKAKRRQMNKQMASILGSRKQEILDEALSEALAKF